jgi:hypothetical protein
MLKPMELSNKKAGFHRPAFLMLNALLKPHKPTHPATKGGRNDDDVWLMNIS